MPAEYAGLASCWIDRAYEEFQTEEGKALLKKWGLPDTCAGVGHCILGYAYPLSVFPSVTALNTKPLPSRVCQSVLPSVRWNVKVR